MLLAGEVVLRNRKKFASKRKPDAQQTTLKSGGTGGRTALVLSHRLRLCGDTVAVHWQTSFHQPVLEFRKALLQCQFRIHAALLPCL